MTHILYGSNKQLVKAIIKSQPRLWQLFGLKLVTFSQETIWGAGKLDTMMARVFVGG